MSKKYNEIRLDAEGNEDDIVIHCDFVHLEKMDNNRWWLGVYRKNKRITFNLVATEEGVMCESVENELKIKKVKLKNGKNQYD